MRTWTAKKHVDAATADVLDVLTDTDACRDWSPVPFDLDDVCASVSVRSGRGLFGRLAEQATAALLHAGALGVAVDRIARSATA